MLQVFFDGGDGRIRPHHHRMINGIANDSEHDRENLTPGRHRYHRSQNAAETKRGEPKPTADDGTWNCLTRSQRLARVWCRREGAPRWTHRREPRRNGVPPISRPRVLTDQRLSWERTEPALRRKKNSTEQEQTTKGERTVREHRHAMKEIVPSQIDKPSMVS